MKNGVCIVIFALASIAVGCTSSSELDSPGSDRDSTPDASGISPPAEASDVDATAGGSGQDLATGDIQDQEAGDTTISAHRTLVTTLLFATQRAEHACDTAPEDLAFIVSTLNQAYGPAGIAFQLGPHALSAFQLAAGEEPACDWMATAQRQLYAAAQGGGLSFANSDLVVSLFDEDSSFQCRGETHNADLGGRDVRLGTCRRDGGALIHEVGHALGLGHTAYQKMERSWAAALVDQFPELFIATGQDRENNTRDAAIDAVIGRGEGLGVMGGLPSPLQTGLELNPVNLYFLSDETRRNRYFLPLTKGVATLASYNTRNKTDDPIALIAGSAAVPNGLSEEDGATIEAQIFIATFLDHILVYHDSGVANRQVEAAQLVTQAPVGTPIAVFGLRIESKQIAVDKVEITLL